MNNLEMKVNELEKDKIMLVENNNQKNNDIILYKNKNAVSKEANSTERTKLDNLRNNKLPVSLLYFLMF
jgi:hypothetical protein